MERLGCGKNRSEIINISLLEFNLVLRRKSIGNFPITNNYEIIWSEVCIEWTSGRCSVEFSRLFRWIAVKLVVVLLSVNCPGFSIAKKRGGHCLFYATFEKKFSSS